MAKFTNPNNIQEGTPEYMDALRDHLLTLSDEDLGKWQSAGIFDTEDMTGRKIIKKRAPRTTTQQPQSRGSAIAAKAKIAPGANVITSNSSAPPAIPPTGTTAVAIPGEPGDEKNSAGTEMQVLEKKAQPGPLRSKLPLIASLGGGLLSSIAKLGGMNDTQTNPLEGLASGISNWANANQFKNMNNGVIDEAQAMIKALGLENADPYTKSQLLMRLMSQRQEDVRGARYGRR